ncbi:MAG: DUF3027 domain-containing protein [Sciscionella sp.]|nr:DUF3027 domain-containing protein [Sciscionella sp.]
MGTHTSTDNGTDAVDSALLDAVDVAREAALELANAGPVGEVGEHVLALPEDGAVTHLFDAIMPGYRGWRWAVTVANAGVGTPVTVSEAVLLPGPDALVGPQWVPWEQRVRAGDLGVGDVLPTKADDPRLVPGYLHSDDPAVEEVAHEVGLGRERVLSRQGRQEAAQRWRGGERGPRSDMARSAPASCGSCGFYVPLAGSLRAAFGACANIVSPADGQVVHAEYGCGAHSSVESIDGPSVPVADLVYDDTTLDVEDNKAVVPQPNPPTEPVDDGESDAAEQRALAESAEQPESVETEPTVEASVQPVWPTEDSTTAEDSPAEVIDDAGAADVDADVDTPEQTLRINSDVIAAQDTAKQDTVEKDNAEEGTAEKDVEAKNPAGQDNSEQDESAAEDTQVVARQEIERQDERAEADS